MKKNKIELVYLLSIDAEEKDYTKIQNYLFRKKEDAIKVIQKDYYFKPTKNKRVWERDGIKAILTELILG